MKWVALSCFFLPCYCWAQEYPRKDIDLSQLADEVFAVPDQDLNYEELYENMVQLRTQPINLNSASAEELRFLTLLSESQIQNLKHHIEVNGMLISLYELQAIPGFDSTTISLLLPFVEVRDPKEKIDISLLTRILQEENNYFIARYTRTLETKAGYHPDAGAERRFRGSAGKAYLRFRTAKPGDFSIGFTAEKDEGEPIYWKPSERYYGFDYWSFHVQLQNKGRLKNIILGDFQNQFAQGLMLGGAFGMGKGSETILTTRRSNLGFLPYTSINEVSLFRGMAATYEVAHNVFVSGFFSHIARDASVTLDTTDSSIASFQSTGLHRNKTELTRRKQIGELNYGIVLQYSKNKLDVGLCFNTLSFSLPVEKDKSTYNQFSFRGRKNMNAGLFVNYNIQNFTLFSEVVKTVHGGWGMTGGMLGSISNKLDISLLFRNFARDFRTFYANPFAESSIAQNESGLYWGWKYRFNRKFLLTGYDDLFKFPWIRYRSYVPSSGHEWLMRFSYTPTRKATLTLQFREEKKVKNLDDSESYLYLTAEGRKQNFWLSADYSIHQKVKLKTRGQFSTYRINGLTTKGVALYQDINIDFGRLNLSARYALFDTDDYDNRQYAFENNVWLAYSLPAYYGEGVRHYLLAEYTINKKLRLWVRFARTRYSDRETIGTGLDAIDGNTRSDLSVQLKWSI